MLNKNYLLACKTADITKQGIEALAEVSALDIAGGTVEGRVAAFVKSVKNPYCFRVKSTPVKLVFQDKAAAPAVETLLVNIATRRTG